MKTLVLLFALTLSCFSQPLSPNDPSFLQSTSPLRRGLVGYWRLEEASGTRYDCSQCGNHLTSNNNVGQGNGVQTKCSTFVAASVQYLSIADNASLDFGGKSLTCAFWVNPSSLSATGNWLVDKRGGASDGEFQILILGSDSKVYYDMLNSDCSDGVVTNSAAISTGVWSFIGMRWDNTSKVLTTWLNGTAVTATNLAYSITAGMTGALGIGTAVWSPLAIFSHSGSIDEAGIWNRPLADAEIAQLYNAGLGTHFPWAHP